MNKPDLVPIKQSVSTKLFRTMFPLYLLIAAVVTMIHMVLEFNNTRQHVAEELETVGNVLRPGLVTALWNINHEQVEAITRGAERMPIVTGIQVEDEQGKVINRLGETENCDVRVRASGKARNSLTGNYFYSEPLVYTKSGRDYKVGKLTLFSSPRVVFNRIQLNFFLIVLNALIKSLALLLLFILFARIIISKPLQELTTLISNTDMGNLSSGGEEAAQSSENNEFVLLKTAFNGMRKKLSEAHGRLQLHSDELERVVEERTNELANREERLQVAYDQLKVARDRELKILDDKRQFIADVSHELRTPVSVMKLQLEAMRQHVGDEETGREVMGRKIEQMERLITDLYTLAKADIDQLSLSYETFELPLLMDGIFDAYQHLARQKQINLQLQKTADSLPLVHADWERLSQVFSNLLENSLNYTNSGGIIAVAINLVGRQVEVVVEDSAPGVSDDDLPRLTERLFRVDASRSRNTGGSGLGLAICESIVVAHGGRLILQHSELGGLKVSIVLPTIENKDDQSTDS